MDNIPKGSLSALIDADVFCVEFRLELRQQFEAAVDTGNWAEYQSQMHFALLKIKNEMWDINHERAIAIILYYHTDVFPKIKYPELMVLISDHLEELVGSCEEKTSYDGGVWHDKVAKSVLPSDTFIIDLKNTEEKNCSYRTFILKRLLYQLNKLGAESILAYKGLLVSIIGVLKNELNSDVTLCKKILMEFTNIPEGSDAFFEAECQDALKEVTAVSDSAKFNVYDFIQKLCMLSPDNISLVSNSGWFDEITNNFISSDPLNQLTTLQLISDFMASETVMNRLVNAGVFVKLQDLLLKYYEEGNIDDLVPAGLMKMFGTLANKKPELAMSEYALSINVILSTIRDADNDLLFVVTFETLVIIAMTSKAKQILGSYFKDEMKISLEKLVFKLRNPPVEFRDRYLMIIAELFKITKKDDDRMEEDDITEMLNWYSIMFPCMSVVIFEKILKMPFNNLHMCSYEVLLSLAGYPWGVKMMCLSDSLLQLLLNRHSENSKEGKELKYDIIKKLMLTTRLVKEEMNEKTTEKMRDYLRKGALFVQPFDDEMEMMGISR